MGSNRVAAAVLYGGELLQVPCSAAVRTAAGCRDQRGYLLMPQNLGRPRYLLIFGDAPGHQEGAEPPVSGPRGVIPRCAGTARYGIWIIVDLVQAVGRAESPSH